MVCCIASALIVFVWFLFQPLLSLFFSSVYIQSLFSRVCAKLCIIYCIWIYIPSVFRSDFTFGCIHHFQEIILEAGQTCIRGHHAFCQIHFFVSMIIDHRSRYVAKVSFTHCIFERFLPELTVVQQPLIKLIEEVKAKRLNREHEELQISP